MQIQADPMPTEETSKMSPPQVGQCYDVEIVGWTQEGDGVCKVNGFALFVADALPNERMRVRITAVAKRFGRAVCIERDVSSVHRVVAPCAVYAACGGCSLQQASYEEQLRMKRQLVVDALERIGKIKVAVSSNEIADDDAGGGCLVHDVWGMAHPWHYRNHVQFAVGKDAHTQQLKMGFYAKHSHDIVEPPSCLIQHRAFDRVMVQIRQLAQEMHIPPYEENTQRGWLRHVILRTATQTGAMMVVLVVSQPQAKQRDAFVARLTQIENVQTIALNIQRGRTSKRLGETTHVVWGTGLLEETIDGLPFSLSAQAFFQVNMEQTQRLYACIRHYAGIEKEDVVLDVYCGVGTISLYMARYAKHVYGIEYGEMAIADARRNAQQLAMTNVSFACGKAEEVLPKWQRDGMEVDVVIVDPPRQGCAAAVLTAIVAMQPRRIVYVSCDVATLARDALVLYAHGYVAVEVQPVDMFAQTGHVETVVLMSRKP